MLAPQWGVKSIIQEKAEWYEISVLGYDPKFFHNEINTIKFSFLK
ncbi:hypothetical protein CY0110_14535 [Crocosphaera chwakensis CCY0110]|uniref:Uncharacterized protein n=1 Tax=Crocosphaera chwakensis CCY0110 TaxID=391612 RepID=A3IZ12_9CHRO|nr:hypothetical protein CY0110_14535 [Crocosphaera chwakensis CCY0110]